MMSLDLSTHYWQGKNNKYEISWCSLCDTAIIICPEEGCSGTSCNAMGCAKCIDDTQEFNRVTKTCIEDYLNEEEIKIYDKIKFLKKYILESISNGDKEINWLKMKDDGKLCQLSEEIFHNEIEIEIERKNKSNA